MATLPKETRKTTGRSKTRLRFPALSDRNYWKNPFAYNSLLTPFIGLIGIILLAMFGVLFSNISSLYFIGAGIAGLILVAIILYRLNREYIKPLGHLRTWSRELRKGNLAIHVPVPKQGKLVSLIRDINGLTDELNGLTEEMDNKVRAQTEHIANKSRSLEILYDIATDLSTARNLDDLLEQFLDTLMVLTDARAASVRLITDKHQTVLVASRGLSASIIEQERQVDMDRCLCGHIAQDGSLGIQEGIIACNNFVSEPMVSGNCREMIVIPLQYRERILGVYNLFLEQPSAGLGKDIRDLLNSIGMHLGLAIEKAKLDENERRLAIMEERNFIGNELHDSLAQSLVSMRLQVKMLGEHLHLKDKVKAQNEVRSLRTAIDEAHVSLRELLANFRSRMDERGLIPSIEELVERFETETGITIYLQNEWSGFTFSPIQEVQIFRIIQESLANIRKHSNASNVRILLGKLDVDHYSVLVEDDGRGTVEKVETSLPGESVGMSIMRDRAERIEGILRVESEPGEGTRVQLAFPANPTQAKKTLTPESSDH